MSFCVGGVNHGGCLGQQLLLFGLLLVTPMELAAQEGHSIDRGVRVRVTAPSYAAERLIGSVISLDVDTLVVLGAQAQSDFSAIPLDSITKFEVSHGRGFWNERWEEMALPVSLDALSGRWSRSIDIDTRIRVQSRSIDVGWLVGTTVSIDSTSIVVKSESSDAQSMIPFTTISYMEASKGRGGLGSRVVSKTLAGVGGGILAVFSSVLAIRGDDVPALVYLAGYPFGCAVGAHLAGRAHGETARPVSSLIGAILGFGGSLWWAYEFESLEALALSMGSPLGAAIGFNTTAERWAEVPLRTFAKTTPLTDRVRVSLSPHGGAGLTVRFEFGS